MIKYIHKQTWYREVCDKSHRKDIDKILRGSWEGRPVWVTGAELHGIGILEWRLKRWSVFHKVDTLIDTFQAEVVVAEAMTQRRENTNCAWVGKWQQSRLEDWVKRGNNRELSEKV